jgi:hypothetical protein
LRAVGNWNTPLDRKIIPFLALSENKQLNDSGNYITFTFAVGFDKNETRSIHIEII